MRTKFRFALAALTAAVLGGQPVFAQQPEAELKKAQEQLEKLLKELKDRETKRSAEAKPVPPVPPAPPAAPAVKREIAWVEAKPAGDSNAVLKALTASKDPKVAAMAKELLEHLNKGAAQPGKPLEMHFELAKPAAGGGVFEFKAVPDMLKTKPEGQFEYKVVPFPGTPATKIPPATATPETKVERRVIVVGDKADPSKPVEARVVVVGEKGVETPKHVTVTAVAKAEGVSSLKLSADGKTAALLSADGTITIFDVASGKETMKFKK